MTCKGLMSLCVCVVALAIPHLRHVDVSWCKVAGGRLALLLEALPPGVLQELHLSSCDLTTDDLLQLGNPPPNSHTHTLSLHTSIIPLLVCFLSVCTSCRGCV